jgi:hypothetical protein
MKTLEIDFPLSFVLASKLKVHEMGKICFRIKEGKFIAIL